MTRISASIVSDAFNSASVNLRMTYPPLVAHAGARGDRKGSVTACSTARRTFSSGSRHRDSQQHRTESQGVWHQHDISDDVATDIGLPARESAGLHHIADAIFNQAWLLRDDANVAPSELSPNRVPCGPLRLRYCRRRVHVDRANSAPAYHRCKTGSPAVPTTF